MIVKDIYTQAFLKHAELPASPKEIKGYRPIFWWNIRDKSSGLRLTQDAIDFLNTYDIKTYEIFFPEKLSINLTLLLWLDRNLKTPYYIGKRSIIVLDEVSAVEIYLFAGDIAQLGQSRILSEQLKETSEEE